jgi:hypothetical protein
MLLTWLFFTFFTISTAQIHSGVCANESRCDDPCHASKILKPKEYSAIWARRHPSIAQAYRDSNCKVCVEIGIARGELSHYLLKNVHSITEYHAVDPFLGGYDSEDYFSVELSKLNSSQIWAKGILHRFREFGCTFKLHYGLSSAMASHFSREYR